MKPKAKTLQERFGFVDEDLRKLNHDDIMLWMDDNAESILSKFIFIKNEREPDDRGNFSDGRKRIVFSKWEVPIQDKSFIIGFVDMIVIIEHPYLAEVQEKRYEKAWLEWKKATTKFIIEVKTQIPSLGELIRQLNMYKVYENHKDTVFCVVSPDDRFAEKIESLGFRFIKYDNSKP